LPRGENRELSVGVKKVAVFVWISGCILLVGCGDQRDEAADAETPAPTETETAKEPEEKPGPKTAEAPSEPSDQTEKAKEPEKPTLEARLEKMYPMPDYKPLEDLVDNWKDVPKNVVEAVGVVTVEVPAEYKLFANGEEIGSSKVPAGHRAKPLDFKPGKLLLTNSRDGKTRAVVNIDDTNFKEQVRALYDQQVEKGRKRVLAARKAAREGLAQAGGDGAADFGGPESDPRFKPAVDYLASGKMTTRTLEEAKRWLWLGEVKHEGKTYDAILVDFEVETIFGTFPHSMKALLKNGKVQEWIMAGYGE